MAYLLKTKTCRFERVSICKAIREWQKRDPQAVVARVMLFPVCTAPYLGRSGRKLPFAGFPGRRGEWRLAHTPGAASQRCIPNAAGGLDASLTLARYVELVCPDAKQYRKTQVLNMSPLPPISRLLSHLPECCPGWRPLTPSGVL